MARFVVVALFFFAGSIVATSEDASVAVPVVVIDEDGKLYGALNPENFTVLENGIKQRITGLRQDDSPLSIVLLMEYSEITNYLYDEIVLAARSFVSEATEPDDYIAVVGYSNEPVVLSDFTRNRQKLFEAFSAFRTPSAFGSSNLFDGIKFVLTGGEINDMRYTGLSNVEGRTAVIVIGTGLDHFSGTTFGDIRDQIAYTGIPIYSIGVGEFGYLRAEPYLSGTARLEFLQAQNTLRTISEESGGRYYSIRFQGALPDVMESIGAMLQNQYILTYVPRAPIKPNGDRQEIEVLVDVDGDGRPDNEDLDLQYRHYRIGVTS